MCNYINITRYIWYISLSLNNMKNIENRENICRKERWFNKIGSKLTRNIQSLDKIRLLKKLRLYFHCLKAIEHLES